MIEYVVSHNPDDRVLKKACELINRGELVCIPTDTNWVVITSPYSKKGMEKLYKLKGEDKSKHYSLLCPSYKKAQEVAQISDFSFKLLRRITPGHYTFIFEATKQVAKAIKASKTDKEVGLRFVPSFLVEKLLEKLDDNVISTNIPREEIGISEDEELYSYQIEDSSINHLISLIIDPGEIEFEGPSTIVSLINDDIDILREGSGSTSF